MKKYKIQDREAGNVIEENLTFEQAQEMVLAFVKADKKEGNYTPEFYEIKEMETNITFSKWELNKPFEGDNRPFISEGDTIICYMVPNPSASLNNQPTMDAQAQAIASLPDIMRENEELELMNFKFANENEELKARCETYKKDYDSMVKEVLRLSGENSELFSALNYLLSSYNADFELITGTKLNDTEAVKKAKLAITKATK